MRTITSNDLLNLILHETPTEFYNIIAQGIQNGYDGKSIHSQLWNCIINGELTKMSNGLIWKGSPEKAALLDEYRAAKELLSDGYRYAHIWGFSVPPVRFVLTDKAKETLKAKIKSMETMLKDGCQ